MLSGNHGQSRCLEHTFVRRRDDETHSLAGIYLASTVRYLGAVEEELVSVGVAHSAQPYVRVVLDHYTAADLCPHGIILPIGSSMMSLAPASFRRGIRVLMPDLSTTVSTAYPSPPHNFETVGAFMAGIIATTSSS